MLDHVADCDCSRCEADRARETIEDELETDGGGCTELAAALSAIRQGDTDDG